MKLEQDLAIRQQEAEQARAFRFRALPVPAAVAEPRYERMLMEEEVSRQINKDVRLAELAR